MAALSLATFAATRGFATMRPTVYLDKIARPALQPLLVLPAILAGSGATVIALAYLGPYLPVLAAGRCRTPVQTSSPASSSSRIVSRSYSSGGSIDAGISRAGCSQFHFVKVSVIPSCIRYSPSRIGSGESFATQRLLGQARAR